ncbi:MAG: hypothetical protein II986_03380 [Alistipes sp.]|nr:hypothetical protein [Alistipes sp.]
MKTTLYKICIVAVCTTITLACAPTKWTNITDSVNLEQLMVEKFPELNKKRIEGKIIIDKIEQRTDKDGKIIYRVTYGDRYNSNNDDDLNDLLWQTVYMPVVNQ